MSTFSFTPAIGVWVGQITQLINEPGGNSIYKVIKDFEGQMEQLLQPGVWTGYAALQNYKNFDAALNSMVQFSNNFGTVFVTSMQEVTKMVANLEVSNLGADTNINGVLQDATYQNMPNLAFINATTDKVTYNVTVIESIDAELAKIANNLNMVVDQISKTINQLNSGNGELWDGEAAELAKLNLNRSLSEGFTQVTEALSVCINNIKSAAQAAHSMDNQMGYAFEGSQNVQGAMSTQTSPVTGFTDAAAFGMGAAGFGAIGAAVTGAPVPGATSTSAPMSGYVGTSNSSKSTMSFEEKAARDGMSESIAQSNTVRADKEARAVKEMNNANAQAYMDESAMQANSGYVEKSQFRSDLENFAYNNNSSEAKGLKNALEAGKSDNDLINLSIRAAKGNPDGEIAQYLTKHQNINLENFNSSGELISTAKPSTFSTLPESNVNDYDEIMGYHD